MASADPLKKSVLVFPSILGIVAIVALIWFPPATLDAKDEPQPTVTTSMDVQPAEQQDVRQP